MKKLIVAMALAPLLAVAQQPAAEPKESDAPVANTGLNPDTYIPYGSLKGVTAEDLQRAKQLGIDVANQILNTYETQKTPEMEKTASTLKRKADQIADEAISAERDKVLEFLGINPESDTAVYIFVSWSMPLEMLRSYAIEAMWSGATLVFKGVPPGKELGKFIVDDLRNLVYGKGAAANISLDPRLFDAYAVNAVPTVVFSKVRANMQCQGIEPVSVTLNDQTASYDKCPALGEDQYWKLSGAVTLSYALQAFIDDGASQAQTHLTALAKGWAEGKVPAKEQVAFKGKWDDVLSPAQVQAAQDAAKGMMSNIQNTQTPQ